MHFKDESTEVRMSDSSEEVEDTFEWGVGGTIPKVNTALHWQAMTQHVHCTVVSPFCKILQTLQSMT